MSAKPRIAAFYSRGTHYPRLLRFLREEYPGCELTAVVPPGYPERLLEGACDRVVRTARDHYGAGDTGELMTLVSQLRAERYDAFVVMFPSIKLRLLAKGAGAASAYIYTADRRFLPVAFNPIAEATDYLLRNIRGRLTYAWIACVVKFRRVGK
jgi:ADP-heptose:LPS heptosyltransferase